MVSRVREGKKEEEEKEQGKEEEGLRVLFKPQISLSTFLSVVVPSYTVPQ